MNNMDNAVRMRRAARFRELRKRAGISQRDLADKLDVSTQRVKNWEAGRTAIPHDAIRMAAGLLHCSVKAFDQPPGTPVRFYGRQKVTRRFSRVRPPWRIFRVEPTHKFQPPRLIDFANVSIQFAEYRPLSLYMAQSAGKTYTFTLARDIHRLPD